MMLNIYVPIELLILSYDYSGYNTVVTIPSGATDIVIQQSSQGEGKDDNYLAIRNGNNTFLLNGGFVLNVFPIELEVKIV